ncbi:MAG: hypothetical protein WAK10_06510 [Methanoregula sp.]
MSRLQTTRSFISDTGNQPVISTVSPGRLLFIFFLIFITIAVAIVLNANPGVPVPDDGTGTLAGNVSIGPLCPVEPCTLDPDRLASVYAARTIVVSAQGGEIIANIVPDPDTGYSVLLKPGTYSVDIRGQGIDRSPDLPETITIRAGETVRLDILIDTGIR